MMDIIKVLAEAVKQNVSDVLICPGFPVAFKCAGSLIPQSGGLLLPSDTEAIIRKLYELASNRRADHFLETGDDDFSFSLNSVGRFRASVFRQRGTVSAVIRVVCFELPDPGKLNIPPAVIDLYTIKKGLVLITGPAGSGKSTTLSCIVDKINRNLPYHVITIEDPIEYLYRNDKSIVSQREVNHDTADFGIALRFALRQSPNVILVGEMRDFETISIAMTAAETGQYVLSTLHTVGAANTIDRIIDVFPAARQQQVRVQLSMVLQAVVSQQLIPTLDGGAIPAFEIMGVNSAIRNLIREGKVHQISNVIHANPDCSMVTMDASIYQLYLAGRISKENAVIYSMDPDAMKKKLSGK